MKLAISAAAFVAALVAPGAVESGTAPRTFAYRISGAAWNLGPSPGCPGGSARYDIRTSAGRHVGTSTLCVLDAAKRDAGARVTVVSRIAQTDAFADGWLRARGTETVAISGDGSRGTVSLRGAVVGGTGRYRRARGTIAGVGVRRGDTVEIRVTVKLR